MVEMQVVDVVLVMIVVIMVGGDFNVRLGGDL